MTQDKAASRIGVSRATFAQWETARHLPAEERVHELDKLLRAGGELIAAAEEARPGHRARSPEGSAPAAGTRSLLHVLADTRKAFLEQLCTDENGRPTGWRHHLVPSDDPPSVLSTAYGLKVLAMLGGPDASTPAVVQWVLDRAVRDGDRLVGWRARAQRAPRMEMTATALEALLHAGVPIGVDDVVRMLADLVDDSVRARPFIISSALEPLLRVAPDSGLAADLVRMLLDCRVDFGGVRVWPEKLLHRDQPMLSASLAHTACAVTVLRGAPEELLGDSVRSAEDWIADQDDLNGVSEIIRRDLADDQREELSIHHFTSTWVVRALAGVAEPDRRLINHALDYIWDRYDPNLHFWAWGNGDTPVWMLADAVAALQDAAFAFLPAPAPADTG
jgi:transcriptional regulator with XRE-family HTH domain